MNYSAANRPATLCDGYHNKSEAMEAVKGYFSQISENEGQAAWRLRCFATSGAKYADYVEANHFKLAGKRVLDLACAWGGHMMAFAARGATVHGSDLEPDHGWDTLRPFLEKRGWPGDVKQGDCQCAPWDGQYDVILALDLIEHIPSPEALSSEIKRLLAPGGICILTTPAKLLSAFWKEPHWQMRGLSLLPFGLQRPVAQAFGKSYPFPIERQYWRAGQIADLFDGYTIKPVAASRKLPLPALAWGFLAITKP